MTVSAVMVGGLAATINAQGGGQFQSDLRVRDGDGHSGTAKLYVGVARLRMDFPVGGETRPTIVDPKKETQFTVSPGKKSYMEMPLGESGGVVRIPRIGALNPANPCSNEHLSDCKRLGSETVNGFATEKWEYTNVDGDKETAWIATKLRFPIRTSAANGASTEITNVVEGPQAASLFDLPRGYAKVDDLGDGDMPNIDPAMMQKALAMAKAMQESGAAASAPPDNSGRGAGPAGRSTGNSPYEGGPGWMVNVTITAKANTDDSKNAPVQNRLRVTSTGRYVASFPLNSGSPGIPQMGPQWSLMRLAGQGSPQADAAPVTFGVDTRVEVISETNGGCGDTAWGTWDDTVVVTEKGQFSTTIAKQTNDVMGTAVWQLNPAKTSYSLIAQLILTSAQGDEVTSTKHVDHCARDQVTNTTTSKKIQMSGLTIDVRDIQLPANPAAGVTGSKTIPWTSLRGATTATLEWTISRIAGGK